MAISKGLSFIYLWGCPNQHMQSHPILCVLKKNHIFFIKKKKKSHTTKPGICPGNWSLLTIKAAQDKAASHPSTSKLQMGLARSTKKVDERKPLRLKAITKSVAFSETPKWAIWETKSSHLEARLRLCISCHYIAINCKYFIIRD